TCAFNEDMGFGIERCYFFIHIWTKRSVQYPVRGDTKVRIIFLVSTGMVQLRCMRFPFVGWVSVPPTFQGIWLWKWFGLLERGSASVCGSRILTLGSLRLCCSRGRRSSVTGAAEMLGFPA